MTVLHVMFHMPPLMIIVDESDQIFSLSLSLSLSLSRSLVFPFRFLSLSLPRTHRTHAISFPLSQKGEAYDSRSLACFLSLSRFLPLSHARARTHAHARACARARARALPLSLSERQILHAGVVVSFRMSHITPVNET